MALKWNMRDMLESVANQKSAPPTSENIVTIPGGMDRLDKSIRELQRRIVTVDGEEHALFLAFQKVERDSEALQSEIQQRRKEMKEQLRRLQGQMVEAVKACGILASLPEDNRPEN